MAIKWGPETDIGGPWTFQAGIDFSLSYPGGALDATDTQVTITTKSYIKSGNANWASGTNADYTFTGDQTGSGTGVSWRLDFAGDQDLIATRTQTVTLTSSSQSFTVTAGIQPSKGALGTGWCYVKRTITIPARPVAPPAAPTGLYVSRVSDASQTASWTNKGTTSAPYAGIEVWRSVNGGSFTRFSTIGGSEGSFTRTSVGLITSKNRRYGFKLRAVNSAGVSGFSNTDYISTTPDAPSSAPHVVTLESGAIRIYRPPSVPYVVSRWIIEHAADGVWDSTPLAILGKTTEYWQHVGADPNVTHSYRIVYRSGDVVLYSAPSAETTAQPLYKRPGPPTNLWPNGVVVYAHGPVPFSWDHSSRDDTPQIKRQIRIRKYGEDIWRTDGDEASTSQIAYLDLEQGETFEVQVRTWGSYHDPSDYSTAIITTAASYVPIPDGALPGDVLEPGPPPTVTATGPSEPVRLRLATIRWEYDHELGSPQARWWVEVEDDSTGLVVASASGVNRATDSWTTPNILEDGKTYTARVWAEEPGGTDSEASSIQFTVDLIPPPLPEVFTQGVLPARLRMHVDEGERHVASIFDKGGTRRLFDLSRTTLVRWERKLDDTGEATVSLVPDRSMSRDLSQILPMRHELVIFHNGKRAWEGPITLVQDSPGAFTIKAKDVSFYLNRMVMRQPYSSRLEGANKEYTIDRLARIILTEAERFEEEPLPINIVPYLTVYRGDGDATTSRSTEAGEKYVFDEMDDLAWRGGIDFGVAGRMIYLMDVDTPVGQTRRLTSADFTSEVEVVMYGAELATEAYVTDRQGRWVSHGPGVSPYYGRVELVHGNYAEADDPDAAAAVPILEMQQQAIRDFAPRYPLPMTVRVPQNATLNHLTFHELSQHLFPGVRVPLTAEGTVHNTSRLMKLKNLSVEDFEGKIQASVTLTPASEAAELVGEEE